MYSTFRLTVFLLLAAGAAAWAEVKVAPAGEQRAAAQKVREIFEAKCLDCHGPELPRPKGKFGYVLDLKRVAENKDFIVKGDPENSELYKMVRDDDMPGEDANVPALTKEEKETVFRWIEMGAPPAPANVAEHATPAPPPLPPAMPFWKRALRYVGRFHPVSTHFPVALMFVAVFAEGLGWWTRRETWLNTVRFLLILAALSALATGALGWINASFTSYTGQLAPVLQWHRWLGTGTVVWIVICTGLAVFCECKEGTRQRQQLRGALLVGAALVGISGFLGSALIYGLDHYAW